MTGPCNFDWTRTIREQLRDWLFQRHQDAFVQAYQEVNATGEPGSPVSSAPQTQR